MPGNLLQALDLALSGQWDAAHKIVQQYEADTTAAWIHAVLHKIEGDLDNAEGLYRVVGAFTLKGLDTKAFVDERFAFFGKVLSGTPEMPDRWKRASIW